MLMVLEWIELAGWLVAFNQLLLSAILSRLQGNRVKRKRVAWATRPSCSLDSDRERIIRTPGPGSKSSGWDRLSSLAFDCSVIHRLVSWEFRSDRSSFWIPGWTSFWSTVQSLFPLKDQLNWIGMYYYYYYYYSSVHTGLLSNFKKRFALYMCLLGVGRSMYHPIKQRSVKGLQMGRFLLLGLEENVRAQLLSSLRCINQLLLCPIFLFSQLLLCPKSV